ncbi:MAG: hypothetical protein M1825_000662 [Sarcosagium campestre]|nr:MAG: hypothetical protein M1825_000662 [Sarcosagium campestre]
MGVKCVGIKMDVQGLMPDHMDDILSNWDPVEKGAPKPWLLYTVPSGQNPTGATQGTERRREIYRVAQKHDVYILEDEPYYFLQMQPYIGASAAPLPPPKSHEDFLRSLVPSLLSMDVDGRVMRLDSFSKVIAPGSRIGWITASEQVVDRFITHSNVSVQNPSGISQIVLHKLLDEGWGHGGYLDWLINLRLEYTQRRDVILQACETYLPQEVVRWDPPAAGMFLWMKVEWQRHPDAAVKSQSEIEDAIFEKSVDQGVLVAKGSWFRADKEAEAAGMYFRATFAAAPGDKMTEAIRRFGDALRSQFQIS